MLQARAGVPLLLATIGAAACSSSTRAPTLPSSAGQTSYAIHYNEELNASTKAISEAQAREKKLSAGFAAHVDELRKPDWQRVETIIDDSDEAGKSADFAEAQGEATAIKAFWDSEKNEITARVSGNAQHALQQAGCSAEAAGPISFAVGDALNKQLQKKLRSKNEAFVVIERYKTSLGPQNVASLEKLADEISEASYQVHVLMPVQHDKLKRIVSDKSAVKRTLDRYVEDETAFQKEAGRTEAEKKASQDRINAANKNKAEIDGVAEQAEALSKEADKAIDASKKDYEEALEALKTKVEEKKKAEPASAEKERPRGDPPPKVMPKTDPRPESQQAPIP